MRRNLFTVSRPEPCQAHVPFPADMNHPCYSLVQAHGPALGKTLHSSRFTNLCWRYAGTLIFNSPIQNASGMFREAGLQSRREWTCSLLSRSDDRGDRLPSLPSTQDANRKSTSSCSDLFEPKYNSIWTSLAVAPRRRIPFF